MTITCPRCGMSLRPTSDLPQFQVRCPGCQEVFVATRPPMAEEQRSIGRRVAVLLALLFLLLIATVLTVVGVAFLANRPTPEAKTADTDPDRLPGFADNRKLFPEEEPREKGKPPEPKKSGEAPPTKKEERPPEVKKPPEPPKKEKPPEPPAKKEEKPKQPEKMFASIYGGRMPATLADLTYKEFNRQQFVIDRFILADIGKLQGAERNKVIAEFNALPVTSVPALVNGLNRATKIPAPSPALTFANKLIQISGATNDLDLLDYIYENVGAGFTPMYHQNILQEVKAACLRRLAALTRAAYVKEISSYAKDFVLDEKGEVTTGDSQDHRRPGHHVKVHMVKMAPGDIYLIHCATTSHDSWLRLEDGKQKEIESNDDFGNNRNSRIIFTPSYAGVYRIVVSTKSPGEAGPYTLTVAKVSPRRK